MTPIFCLILNMTVAGSLMIPVVLLLRRLLRSRIRKSWFILLWAIVFCRFALPFFPASPLSLLNVLPPFYTET